MEPHSQHRPIAADRVAPPPRVSEVARTGTLSSITASRASLALSSWPKQITPWAKYANTVAGGFQLSRSRPSWIVRRRGFMAGRFSSMVARAAGVRLPLMPFAFWRPWCRGVPHPAARS